jgi:4-amino-4-deoxy-L-arabinose transferase-like glycosyltransferase
VFRVAESGAREGDGNQWIRSLEAAFLGAGIVAIVLLWDRYGISWDESMRALHGEMVLEYFRSAGESREVTTHPELSPYTALPDLLAALAYRALPQWKYAIRHTVSALFALATIPALFRFTRQLGDAWAGPLAALILLTLPAFSGHAFINSKDIPLACAFAWAMVALAWTFRNGRVTLRTVVVGGLGFALPLMIRPGILPVLLFFYGVLLVFTLAPRDGREDTTSAAGWALATVGIFTLSWLAMILVWPWAHERPLFHPLSAFLTTGAFPMVIPVLFDGSVHASDALPRRYLLQMLVVKTPLPVSALALTGLAVGIGRVFRSGRAETTALLVGIVWLMVPVAAWTLLTPTIYDGIRHFLFVVPSLAVWSAVGLLWLVRRVGGSSSVARGLVLAAGVCLVLWPVKEMTRLHPYEMTYYNRLVGGLDGAAGRYETDYWVTSYREAAEWIRAVATPAEGEEPVRVLVAANNLSHEAARHYLQGPFEVGTIHELSSEPSLPEGVDFYLATTRFGWASNFPRSPVVHVVGRGGATFTIVRSRAGWTPPASERNSATTLDTGGAPIVGTESE